METDLQPSRTFTRPVRKCELAAAIPCSLSTLNRYIETGRIAQPGLRYSQRLIFYTPWQANEILAGRTGEVSEDGEDKQSSYG